MNFFGFLTLDSLIPKAFQTLLSKHLFPTENLFSISGPPEHIIGIPSPVHGLIVFLAFLLHYTHPSEPLHIVSTLEDQAEDLYTI